MITLVMKIRASVMFAAFQHAAYAYSLQETSDLDLLVITYSQSATECVSNLDINLGLFVNDCGDAQYKM